MFASEGPAPAGPQPARADSNCVARLRAAGPGAEPAAVFPYIGGSGAPAALFTPARQTVAPIYRACAQSFTTHLVERAGVPGVVSVFPAIPQQRVAQRIAEVTGRPLPVLREVWLAKLGLPGSVRR